MRDEKGNQMYVNIIVFLDIDGVLNGYTKTFEIFENLIKKFHLNKLKDFMIKHYDVFGVRVWKVFYLKLICVITGSKVVISSSWRSSWYKTWDPKDSRMGKLHLWFERFGIEVVGITELDESRPTAIAKYCEKYRIHNYVILDDERFEFTEEQLEHTVLTVNPRHTYQQNDYIGYKYTGMKLKHVISAIHILSRH